MTCPNMTAVPQNRVHPGDCWVGRVQVTISSIFLHLVHILFGVFGPYKTLKQGYGYK